VRISDLGRDARSRGADRHGRNTDRAQCGQNVGTRHTVAMEAPFDQASAEAAEGRGDWAVAIAMVSGFSECYSRDHYRHNAHLWHMELLVKAGLLHELAELAQDRRSRTAPVGPVLV
jgi:hypothetical protein